MILFSLLKWELWRLISASEWCELGKRLWPEVLGARVSPSTQKFLGKDPRMDFFPFIPVKLWRMPRWSKTKSIIFNSSNRGLDSMRSTAGGEKCGKRKACGLISYRYFHPPTKRMKNPSQRFLNKLRIMAAEKPSTLPRWGKNSSPRRSEKCPRECVCEGRKEWEKEENRIFILGDGLRIPVWSTSHPSTCEKKKIPRKKVAEGRRLITIAALAELASHLDKKVQATTKFDSSRHDVGRRSRIWRMCRRCFSYLRFFRPTSLKST